MTREIERMDERIYLDEANKGGLDEDAEIVSGDVLPLRAGEIYAASDANRAEFVRPDTGNELYARIAELERERDAANERAEKAEACARNRMTAITVLQIERNEWKEQCRLAEYQCESFRKKYADGKSAWFIERDIWKSDVSRFRQRMNKFEADARALAQHYANGQHDPMCAIWAVWKPHGACDCGARIAKKYLDKGGEK